MESCPVIGMAATSSPNPPWGLGFWSFSLAKTHWQKCQQKCSVSNFSTHTVVTPLAQHFCRDKSQQMLTKSELIFLRAAE